MTTGEHFSVHAFCNSDDPWEYMNRVGLTAGVVVLSDDELSELQEAIPSLDEYHLAHALVIAEHAQPTRFGVIAADLLQHSSMSVRINAYRVLRAIPADDLSQSLIARVKHNLHDCPEQKEFADAVCR